MTLEGRVLWLAEEAALLKAQLEGGDALATPGPRLQYGVNTDAVISGAACILGYTGEILGPYLLDNFKNAVRQGDIAGGGFEVVRRRRCVRYGVEP